VQVTVVLLLGKLVFAVPIRGQLVDVYIASLLFIVASLALGLLISTLAKSQFQSMQLAFFTFLPQILLSGFMFPYEGMPRAAQWLAEILPMTHFIRLIRGIMIRASRLSDMPTEILALLLIAMVLLVVSTRRIHKRLD
jgi:ABC-2 type transport system permease protein